MQIKFNQPRLLSLLLMLLLLSSITACAQQNEAQRRDWNRRVQPFRVIGNIYYVGVAGVSSFLITTPDGHILLDSGLVETVPIIQDNMKQLGFRIEDVKILINSHAHFDHAGGLAELKRLTNAKLIISDGDADLIKTGGKSDFQWGHDASFHFEPASVDRTLHDNDRVELGGVTMTARITPGHTRGCTTWTMKVPEAGRDLDVVIIGSTTIPGYKLVNNPRYPNIADDYAHSFSLLRSLKCDVFLGPHGSFFALEEKRLRLEQGEERNPFIDPEGYKRFIEETEAAYQKQLKEEQLKEGAELVPCSQPSAEQRALIHAAEKGRYTTRRVEFSGNAHTRDQVLRQKTNIGLQEGELFTRNNLLKSLLNVSKLNVIHPVSLEDVVLHINEKEKMVDLTICFRERNRPRTAWFYPSESVG